MVSRRILALVFVLLISIMACEDDSVSPPPEPTWWLEPDSVNIGILVLDYLTYEFEGGWVGHFSPCNSCGQDSLPFEQIYEPPLDLGSVTFRLKETGDTLLYASVVWMGPGRIEYPDEFLPPSDFHRLGRLPNAPLGIEYFYNDGKAQPYAEADSAWSSVRNLDIMGEFASLPYRVGVYWHGARYANPDPERDSWVIFIYRDCFPHSRIVKQ
jgi:hypothetical protein